MGTRCAALVLAAGESRRMGRPKALLELAGVPLIRQHVERLRELGAEPVLAIVRPELSQSVGALFAGRGASPAPTLITAATQTQAASLAVLVRALGRAAPGSLGPEPGLLVTPVDLLPARLQTLRALLSALDERVWAATPRYRGRGGHPVALRAELAAAYLSGPLESCPPLRDLLARAGARRSYVDVDDPAVLGDADTEAEARMLGLTAPGRALR